MDDMKTYSVYRLCSITGLKVSFVKLCERRRQERGSNDLDMMRLAEKLCDGGTGDLRYLIVVSEK